MSIPVNFVFSNLPSGYCWPGAEQYWADVQALIAATVDGGVGLNFGDSTPGADQRGLCWVRTDANGSYIRTYTFANGLWVSPHPIPPSSSYRSLWVGSEASLKTFDEGVDEATTALTGPFWEVDHDFDFRCLMGPGTNGTTYNEDPATTLAVGGTAGAEKVALSLAELPEHKHYIAANVDLADFSSTLTASNYAAKSMTKEGSDEDYHLSSSATEAAVGRTSNVGDGDAHNSLPPVRGIFVIKRTARQYYTVAG